MPSRDSIVRALLQRHLENSWPSRAGLRAIAHDALERAGCGDWPDPLDLLRGLNSPFRRVPGVRERAALRMGSVVIRWDPDDARETALNAFIGAALVVAREHPAAVLSRNHVYRLAAYLAIPHRDEPGGDGHHRLYLPPWFIAAAHYRLRDVAAASPSRLRLIVSK